MATRNKLHAAILKAEMRGDTALVAELQKQVAELDSVCGSSAPKAGSPATGLSLSERNKIHARILKAELTGNSDLVHKLKSQLSEAQNAPSDNNVIESPPKNESVRTIHVTKRVPDEDLTVKQLVRKEKAISALKDSIMFVSSSLKTMDKREYNPDDEYDVEVSDKKHKSDIVTRVQQEDSGDDQCTHCLIRYPRELVLSIGKKVFLSLTRSEPLLDGHCQIRSVSHNDTNVVCADEDTISEINQLKRQLVQMYLPQEKSIIFSEIMKHKCKKYDKHLIIDCFPVRESLIPEARMFFKKSLLECEKEWSMNKKLVVIEEKEVSRLLPKSLPYFWVTFGDGNSGFAHVIEEEDNFVSYFAAEVIGGVLDIEPHRWRKPRPNFHRNKNDVLLLKAGWKKFDPFHSGENKI